MEEIQDSEIERENNIKVIVHANSDIAKHHNRHLCISNVFMEILTTSKLVSIPSIWREDP